MKQVKKAPAAKRLGRARIEDTSRAGKKARIRGALVEYGLIGYDASVEEQQFVLLDDIESAVAKVRSATPMQRVSLEKKGIRGRLLKNLARQMAIPAVRLYDIVGIPKATAEKKASEDAVIAGAGGQATIGMMRLLGIAQEIVENSAAAEARGFDVAKWLGEWIEHPQPALGGRRPADILDTPTGIEIVARTLGALESGAFQ